MDDPLVPKRLDEAITMVGTCLDMCPRFERYRRERENNLDKWETIPGTRRVDHRRAVKAYERAAGDKIIPSDLRPPHILKRTLNYLFHHLLLEGGFEATHTFIRDRSRAVRTDFTMQHETGPLAIECHDRCARYHILALHFMREKADFSIALEEQQLMNTLQSLKEFYEDQRQRYQSPTELEMRVYHRLIHIRDQRERHDDIPDEILAHPVFKLTTQFRLIVQRKSSPITKTSSLVVDQEAMNVFGELAATLRDSGNLVMIYLVACILERLFGKDTIEDIEAIRGELSLPDIIDGVSDGGGSVDYEEASMDGEAESSSAIQQAQPEKPASPSVFGSSSASSSIFGQPAQPASVFGSANGSASASATPTPPPVPIASAFSSLKPTPNAFGNNTSVFGAPSVFKSSSGPTTSGSVFGATRPAEPSPQASAPSSNIFGQPSSATSQPAGSAPLSTNAFSTSSSPSIFGGAKPSPPAEAPKPQPPASSIFGSATTSSPSLFGGAKADETSSPFGAPKPAEAPTSSVPFSLFGPSKTPSPSLFGDAKPAGSPAPPPLFGSPSPAPSTFKVPAPPADSAKPAPLLNPAAPAFTPTKPSAKPATPATTLSPSTPANGKDSSPSTPSPRPSLFVSTDVSRSSTNAGAAKPGLTRQDTLILDKSGTPSSSWLSSGTLEPRTPLSEPPPPSKLQPISLPPTPSASKEEIPKAFGRIKGFPSINTDVSSSSGGLSPLFGTPLKSPTKLGSTSSFSLPSPISTPKIEKLFPAALPSAPPVVAPKSDKGKEKEKEEEADPALESKAVSHRERVLLRKTFKRWLRATTDPFFDDKYATGKRKPKQDRPARRRSRSEFEESAATSVSTSAKARRRRLRPTTIEEYARTDEDVVRRLREKHEEYERRWAQGSFLSTVRSVVRKKLRRTPQSWNVWLSMNPDVDSTAIWVQRKFNVPESGRWMSESSFEIPYSNASAAGTSTSAPALLVFECTPIADVEDDLERKYRALDDYARLRDVIASMPARQHYLTSVVFIVWAEEEQQTMYDDLLQTIEKHMEEGSFADYRVLPITSNTKDVDSKFSELMKQMSLDVDGRLSRWYTLNELLRPFLKCWRNQGQDWVERSMINGRFDYWLFVQGIHKLALLLSSMFQRLSTLIEQPSISLSIPPFGDAKDSDSLYEQAASWLQNECWLGTSKDALADLEACRTRNIPFPGKILFENMGTLVPTLLQAHLSVDLSCPMLIPKAQLQLAVNDFEAVVRQKAAEFDELLVRRPLNPSPSKRRISEEHTEDMSSLGSVKRLKMNNGVASSSSSSSNLSATIGSQTNGSQTSQSPSAATPATPDGGSTTVTLAMLRARIREVQEKYGPVP
ncbi:hypothetical protein OE88DRAFT_1659360 [Heliocybe sulcata]|uniref:SAC3/GANP/THP3 conserved domain-containing protein n=1 Tax=Heliocybe sulcata TaxID=5364 RepID=A0A5C3NBY5_9AGAM|nr:hypothetical protein OE88DRAFT_1659360 [Heliocybe sulcata]